MSDSVKKWFETQADYEKHGYKIPTNSIKLDRIACTIFESFATDLSNAIDDELFDSELVDQTDMKWQIYSKLVREKIGELISAS